MRATQVCAALLALVGVGGLAVAASGEPPEGVLTDGFEGPRTVWRQEQTDATITLEAHDRTDRAAHEGRFSERFRFTSGLGSAFYYTYPLPRVAVSDDLKLGLYVRGNRTGAQLFARVVLPSDVDPDTKAASFLLVPGTIYGNVDRWQRLELVDLVPSLERQARVLRASSRRPVKLEGAYIEQLVVNLFSGVGDTEVFLDEMRVGPVTAETVAAFAEDARRREGEGAGAAQADASAPRDVSPPASGATEAGASTARVRLERNRLKRLAEDGLFHDWVFTGIHAPGADVASLRSAGFDVLIDDLDADPQRYQEAVRRGFLLMPMLRRDPDGRLPDAERVAAAAAAFPFRDSVLAWNLGEHLGRATDPRARKDELTRARALVSKLRGLPAGSGRLTTGLVDDDLYQYARFPSNLDVMGIQPAAWASSLEPTDTYQFLRQRRDLTVRANAGALFWAMLPAAAPREVVEAVWGRDVPPAWGSPLVQPEQVRLMTYAALAAGYRGLTFRGDAELTRGPGRMLLLEMAFLNAEIDLFEYILANGADPIPVYRAFDPDPPALPPAGGRVGSRVNRQVELKPLPGILGAGVGTHDRRGVLLLVADLAAVAQFQPPQMARNEVKMTIVVPESAQAFEVSPGRFRVLERERTVGGTRITLPEFDTTALILITTDVAMAERVEAVVQALRPRVAQMAIEQAELKLAWTTEVNGRLAAEGHYLIEEEEQRKRADNGGPAPTDQAELLNKAAENVKAARENLEREDFSTAWSEARRASRPLRILMRGLWDNAAAAMVRANMDPVDLANEGAIAIGRMRRQGPPLGVPAVASAPLSAFNMLPQHYLWVDWMTNAHFGRDLVPGSSFDDPEALRTTGWADQSYHHDGVASKVSTVESGPERPGRHLEMTVEPAEGRSIDELPPFLDAPAAAIRSPAVPVKAGQFLRISVFVKRATATPGGAGGVVVRDSIGGEAMQFVSNAPMPAPTRVVLYRRVPADGELTVLLGLAGYGSVSFDDLRVQRVEAVPEAPDIARLPRPELPPSTAPVR